MAGKLASTWRGAGGGWVRSAEEEEDGVEAGSVLLEAERGTASRQSAGRRRGRRLLCGAVAGGADAVARGRARRGGADVVARRIELSRESAAAAGTVSLTWANLGKKKEQRVGGSTCKWVKQNSVAHRWRDAPQNYNRH